MVSVREEKKNEVQVQVERGWLAGGGWMVVVVVWVQVQVGGVWCYGVME